MPPIRNSIKDWRKFHEEKKKQKNIEIENFLEQNLKVTKELEEETYNGVNSHDVVAIKRNKTLSIALPGSILDNVPCAELQTYLIGQIARAACIYNVDEIIIFDDTGLQSLEEVSETWKNCEFFVKILQYLECPQYLRKLLFPLDSDLKFVGLLNPVEAPHHFRSNQHSLYREGVVTDELDKKGKKSLAEIGLTLKVKLDKVVEPGTRVTVKLPPKCQGSRKLNGVVVQSWEPKVKVGLYWGYTTRLAASLSEVFTDSPYEKGYNLLIGTSDKGTPVSAAEFKKKKKHQKRLHALIVFGGLKGLEFALENDAKLSKDVDEVSVLFDHYLNTCPNQGTRTIRTEEAVLISLAMISNKIFAMANTASSEIQDNSTEENKEL